MPTPGELIPDATPADLAPTQGEIVISGVDTGTPVSSATPTEMHALFQGLLETQHEYPEPDDEDG